MISKIKAFFLIKNHINILIFIIFADQDYKNPDYELFM